MAQDDTKRTLIALGAFSQVVGGGGGDIPEDLAVNSISFNSAFANGPIFIGGSCTTHQIKSVDDDLRLDGDLLHTVGTRLLTCGATLRSGKYYYYRSCNGCTPDLSGVKVYCNETAEIWFETTGTAPSDLAFPPCWQWIGTGPETCLKANHFYDFAIRNVKNVATVANVAFDYAKCSD